MPVPSMKQLSIKGSGQDSFIGVVEGVFLHVRPLCVRKLTFFFTCAKKLFCIVPVVKSCRAAPTHVSVLAGVDLAVSGIISMMS